MIHSLAKPRVIVDAKDYPADNLPEFVFLGRSNVGKSSFINALLNRKNYAYTSQHPGKTQTMNFYLVNDACYFVDMPGYGYARVSKTKRASFGKMIETYLTKREPLTHCFILVDARHQPTDNDILMINYLIHLDLPFSIVLTKADKLSNNKLYQALKTMKQMMPPTLNVELYPFSAIDKRNREEILAKIMKLA